MEKMRRYWVPIVATSLLWTLLLPPGIEAGKYAGEFLTEGVGARALAMGGAYVAVADDATASYWNPAGLPFVSGRELSFSHVSMFEQLANYDAFTLTVPVGQGFGLGLSWIRLGIDGIPRYGELQGTSSDRIGQAHPEWRSTGEVEGTFTDSEQAYVFSFGKRFDFDLFLGGGLTPWMIPMEFSLGASGKYISQSLDNHSGTGQGFDLGTLLRIRLSAQAPESALRSVSLGFALQNLGTKLTWDTEGDYQDEVTRNLRFGLAFTQGINALSSAVTLAAQLDNQYEQEFRYGGEYSFRDVLFLRGGADVDDFTAGAGLKLYMVSLDYAFVGYELGNTHRLSAALTF
jgi:hypothetical protein